MLTQHPHDVCAALNKNDHAAAHTRSLYKVHEEDGKPFEVELSWICDESNKQHQRVGVHTMGTFFACVVCHCSIDAVLVQLHCVMYVIDHTSLP